MGVTDSGVALQTMAIAEASAAACVIPAAWPLVAMMGAGFSDPGGIEKAAGDWDEVAKHIDTIKAEMISLRDGVPEDQWSAQDRERFNQVVTRYNQDLAEASHFVSSVGTIMQAMAYGYFAWSLLVFAAAQVLAVQALAIVASSWFPPAAAALEVAANATAGVFDALMSVASVSLTTAIEVAGGVVGAGMAVYLAAKQFRPGDGAASFTQARLTPGGPMPNPGMA
ncbi:MAG TPA: hypothetical protein VIR27_08575 [Mycobacteriales bacterium]